MLVLDLNLLFQELLAWFETLSWVGRGAFPVLALALFCAMWLMLRSLLRFAFAAFKRFAQRIAKAAQRLPTRADTAQRREPNLEEVVAEPNVPLKLRLEQMQADS